MVGGGLLVENKGFRHVVCLCAGQSTCVRRWRLTAGDIATEAPIPFGRTGKSRCLCRMAWWLSQANRTTYGSEDLSETMRLTKNLLRYYELRVGSIMTQITVQVTDATFDTVWLKGYES